MKTNPSWTQTINESLSLIKSNPNTQDKIFPPDNRFSVCTKVTDTEW